VIDLYIFIGTETKPKYNIKNGMLNTHEFGGVIRRENTRRNKTKVIAIMIVTSIVKLAL